jgi:sortase A
MTVGHFEGMPAVGQGGNTVLAGHSERARGEADIFYNLHRVAVGDHIIITSEDATYRYEVQRIFSVDPRDLSVLYPSGAEQLTLITCDLTSFEEDGSYSRRTVVVAERTR